MTLNTAARVRAMTESEWKAEYNALEKQYKAAERAEQWTRADRLGDKLSFLEMHMKWDEGGKAWRENPVKRIPPPPVQTVTHRDGTVLAKHKITGDFSGKASAWFDSSGRLVDAEQILPNGQNRSVKPNGKIWKMLETKFAYLKKQATKRNPVPSGKIAKANSLYERFRDQKADGMTKVPAPDFSVGMVVGKVDVINYETIRAGKVERYTHKFKKSARPLLCVTADGKNFFSIDGNFEFTERGFLDK
jgi:hypothetical protein